MQNPETQFFLAAIENPMLDLSVYLTDSALIDKYNLEYGRACAANDTHLPLLDEIWALGESKLAMCLGGSALNTVRCANFLFLLT